MTVTTTSLTRAAGVAAAAAGAIFVGVQIGHPQLTSPPSRRQTSSVRDSFKVLFACLPSQASPACT